MERVFFKCLRQKLLHDDNVLRVYLEEFCWMWSSTVAEHDDFIILYFNEVGDALQTFVSFVKADLKNNSNIPAIEYLIRHHHLSMCLDYYENKITPLFKARLLFRLSALSNTNQQLLN